LKDWFPSEILKIKS